MSREYEVKEEALKSLAKLHSKTNELYEEHKKFIINDEYDLESLNENMESIKSDLESLSYEFGKNLEYVMEHKIKYMLNSKIDELLQKTRKNGTNA